MNWWGNENELKIENYKINDDYASALVEKIKFYKSLDKFSLARSKISSKGLWSIIPKLPPTILHLDLSKLKINEKTLILLNDWFDNQTVGVLRSLNLNGTGIGKYEKHRNNLFEAIISICYNLESIDFGNLNLEDSSSEQI